MREIYPQHAEAVLAWIGSPLAQEWVRDGRLVSTDILAAEPDGPVTLEHRRVFFPSYPWEWTPGQWISAASLTLDLCEQSLGAGYILKDASPLNVLFSGSSPIFVDVLSFERRDPTNPMWNAYAQFARTFLLPLAAYSYLGWPLGATQQRRDGYEPADLAPWLSVLRRWSNPLRSLVTLPILLEGRFLEKKIRAKGYGAKVTEDVAQEILRRTLRKTRRQLAALVPPQRLSRWSNYTDTASHYEQKDHTLKQEFVRRSIESILPAHVLDVGANTGVYSRIAAHAGAEVVAWDSDVGASDLNWQLARRDGLSIVPVVADFARPTGALGWRNEESSSLLARAKQRFECVLMLGVLHHLLIADQIPLDAVIDQLAEISIRWAILEWIPQEDSQFAGLCRGREDLYAHLTEDYFLRVIDGRFAIRTQERLPNGRTLWLLEAIS